MSLEYALNNNSSDQAEVNKACESIIESIRQIDHLVFSFNQIAYFADNDYRKQIPFELSKRLAESKFFYDRIRSILRSHPNSDDYDRTIFEDAGHRETLKRFCRHMRRTIDFLCEMKVYPVVGNLEPVAHTTKTGISLARTSDEKFSAKPATHCDESKADQGRHLVILVHGMNTRAYWIAPVKDCLRSVGLSAEPAGYGFYGVARFLLPIDLLRRQAVKRVLRRIDAAVREHQPEKVSVIAHSFGSYVIARIIQDEFRLRWHRVIFCGSVVPATFPFEQYAERISPPVLNEIGTRDIWPALAENVTWGYGSIGSFGFQGAPLEECWFRGYRHSDFLTVQHCKDVWIPFLRDGTLPPTQAPEPLPLWFRLLTVIPIRWLIVLSFLFALSAGLSAAANATDIQWAEESEWLGGGDNPNSVCGGLARRWEASNSLYALNEVPDGEKQRFVGLRVAQYKYQCKGMAVLKFFFWRVSRF